MYPIVIYPVLSGIVATLLIMFVFGPPLAALTQIIVDFFMGMICSQIYSRILDGLYDWI